MGILEFNSVYGLDYIYYMIIIGKALYFYYLYELHMVTKELYSCLFLTVSRIQGLDVNYFLIIIKREVWLCMCYLL